jgi:multiple sugar transport system substrate-binding protein
MRKEFFITLVLMVFLATACGATPTPRPGVQGTQAAATATASAKTIVLTWLVRSNSAEQGWENNDVIAEFEAQNPDIKINLVVVSAQDFDTRLQSMLAGGAAPDVWSQWGSSNFADDVKLGLVADLTPYIEKDDLDLSDFIPDLLNTYKVDGRQMGLPFSVVGSAIFYNKDLFNKSGVAYPPDSWDDPSWTYAKFLDMCKALTHVSGGPQTQVTNTPEPEVTSTPETEFTSTPETEVTSTPEAQVISTPQPDVYGCNMDFSLNDSYAWMYGKDIYPDSAYLTGYADTAYLNDPLIIQAFQDRQNIVWQNHYMPDPDTVAASGGGDLFKMQKVAMQVSDGGGWQQYSGIKDFNWAVAALPYGAPGRFSPTFTDLWMMSAKSAHPQEAWQFLKYLVSPAVQKSWSRATFTAPVRKSLLEDWYGSFSTMSSDEVKEVFEGSLKYGKESPSHLLVHFDRLNQVISAAVDPILNKKATAQETLPAANQKLIETLKEIRAENP